MKHSWRNCPKKKIVVHANFGKTKKVRRKGNIKEKVRKTLSKRYYLIKEKKIPVTMKTSISENSCFSKIFAFLLSGSHMIFLFVVQAIQVWNGHQNILHWCFNGKPGKVLRGNVHRGYAMNINVNPTNTISFRCLLTFECQINGGDTFYFL